MTIMSSILFGGIVAGLFTAFLSLFSRKVGILLLTLNVVTGALGAVSATQLLDYGPVIFGVSIVPMLAGSLVLTGLVSITYCKFVK